jgi:AcrR family transcriptional regulator
MEEKDIKDRILTGAWELFMRYGIRSVSMDDVARHLSVSKKTLYHYFADKDEIVTMVATFHIGNNHKQYEDLRCSAKNAIDELVKISVCLKKDFQKMNPSLLFDLHKFHPTAWNAWLSHKQNDIRQSIIRNLTQGIEEGLYRPEINKEILAAMRLELIEASFNESVFPSSKFNLAEVGLQIFDHFVYGIVTDKGRKMYEKYKTQSNHELIPQSL